MVQLHDKPSAHTVGVDEVVIEPAATAWHRRLEPRLVAGAPPALVAGWASELLAADLRADHVAIWTRAGEEYLVLGAAGLSEGARRMRLPTDHPLVNVCRGLGGRILRDPDTHQGARAPGLPGSSSKAYAMLLLDDAGLVELLTISGPRLLADEVDAVQELVTQLFGARPEGH